MAAAATVPSRQDRLRGAADRLVSRRLVVILHLTIIFGAFAVIMLGAQVLPLVILVTLKTVVDLAFHLREHRSAEGSAAVAEVG